MTDNAAERKVSQELTREVSRGDGCPEARSFGGITTPFLTGTK